jgi:hypothetical protein
MREVQIYIEGQRLELFNDEIIQVTSSVQNVQDIAKVFTDFSQSFTVPASEHNNEIFQHFYESAVDGTIDHRLRRDARIEIDLIPFRTGKIQIEKSNLVKGRVQSYTITFYGDIRTLQDYFGEDKLSSLDMTAYTHSYTGAEVKTRITSSSNYDVRYPLISSERVWTYGDNANTDISQNSHHVHYDELFPAIRISKIFEAIETKYGIDFQGTFLSNKRFTNCYLWLKNKAQYSGFSVEKPVDIYYRTFPEVIVGYDYIVNENIDLTNNTIRIAYSENQFVDSGFSSTFIHRLDLTANINLNAQFYIDVYKNGSLFTTLTNLNSAGAITPVLNWEYSATNTNNYSLDETFNFIARSTTTSSIYIKFDYFMEFVYADIPSITYLLSSINQSNITPISFVSTTDITGNMPDMTVSNFITGILKEFNLTCVPTSPTIFQIEPLEDWYAKGRLIDVTKHIDIDSVDIQRVPVFKNVKFEYEESQSFMNVEFFDNFKRHYGDLIQTFEYDGGDYEIKLPFENLLHNKFTSTNLQVAYSLDKDFSPYIPKPVLLYMNEQKSCSFYFNDGNTTTEITTYMPFGQDLVYSGANYSLNFGWDNSTMLNTPINNNLFITYYYNYLGNLYSKKNRLYYYKGLFPTAILTSLKLNDRLIIRDKRYIINEIKTNTNTGEVDLVLLLDFRPMRATKIPKFPKGIGSTVSTFLLPNKCVQIDIDTGTTGITASPATLTQDGDVTFSITPITEHYILIAENSDTLYTDNYDTLRSEEYNNISYQITVTYTYEDGSTEIEIFTITAEA